MKLLSCILMVGMILYGVPGPVSGADLDNHQAENACQMDCDTPRDCCSSHDYDTPLDCCNTFNGHGDSSHGDPGHHCPIGCHCGCCIHILAIEYQFMTNVHLAPRVVHYGHYTNFYHFDYFNSHFQPPRFS